MIPIFLAKYKEKVLHSGKYLNVFRECGKDIHYPWPEHENMLLSGALLGNKTGAQNQPTMQQEEDEEMKDVEAESQHM